MPPFKGTDEDRAALSAYLLAMKGIEGETAAEILAAARESDALALVAGEITESER